MNLSRISRRQFLYGSAVLAGSVALAACTPSGGGTQSGGGTESSGGSAGVGSSSKPLAVPGKYQQSPLLDSAGLPPVEQRLPEHPYVIPHLWATDGKYGGKLNMNTFTTTGMAKADSNREFFYGHSPLRYLNDGKDVVPGLVETWESNDDASEWTFHFRKGLKWSDGEAWTTENIIWWWQEIIAGQHMAQTAPDEARS